MSQENVEIVRQSLDLFAKGEHKEVFAYRLRYRVGRDERRGAC